MKNTTLAITALTTIMSAFMINTNAREKNPTATSSTQLAEQVVAALQRSSIEEYVSLFPSLSEFEKVMEKNASYYGPHLDDARQAFAADYDGTILPRVKQSFHEVLQEGVALGIDWNTVHYTGIEGVVQHGDSFQTTPLTIVIEAQGKVYRIAIQHAIIVNGQWKTGKAIAFQ